MAHHTYPVVIIQLKSLTGQLRAVPLAMASMGMESEKPPCSVQNLNSPLDSLLNLLFSSSDI